jgi:hypothetical protein
MQAGESNRNLADLPRLSASVWNCESIEHATDSVGIAFL